MVNAEQHRLAHVKKGIALALASGLVFSIGGIFSDNASSCAPFDRPDYRLLAPLFMAFLHDCSAACWTTLHNARTGRLGEVWWSLRSKPGRYVIAGAIFGATLGMGGYMLGLALAGAAHTLPITSLYPGVASVLAIVVLKERVSRRAAFGLVFCVAGACLVGYVPNAETSGPFFHLGILCAALAALGWGLEGVFAAKGMDFLEPAVALNIYYIVSLILYATVIVPCATALALPAGASLPGIAYEFLSSKGAALVVIAGFFGSCSYLGWYHSISIIGVSRAMALNISYALWGVMLASFFTEVAITGTLVAGALVIFAGMVFVIGNPKEMLNLRSA